MEEDTEEEVLGMLSASELLEEFAGAGRIALHIGHYMQEKNYDSRYFKLLKNSLRDDLFIDILNGHNFCIFKNLMQLKEYDTVKWLLNNTEHDFSEQFKEAWQDGYKFMVVEPGDEFYDFYNSYLTDWKSKELAETSEILFID